MIEVYKKTELIGLCKKHGFHFSKRLGQNFLTDKNILLKIIEATAPDSDTSFVEIGPGAGSLTVLLATLAKDVTAVEIDRRVIPLLNEAASGLNNIRVVNCDFLRYPPEAFPESYVLVGNLPYSAAMPILMRVVEDDAVPKPSLMVFMVQKEVADRLLAAPGSKIYGMSSVAVQYHCEGKKLFDVGADAFVPMPKVESTVIRLTVRDIAGDNPETRKRMFAIARAGFNMRRKMLKNALKTLGYTDSKSVFAMKQAEIPENARAETLSYGDYYRLAEALAL